MHREKIGVIHLRWYRDQGNGQKAADHNKEIKQVQDGNWPLAVWVCKDYKEAEQRWWVLLNTFKVNAVTYL